MMNKKIKVLLATFCALTILFSVCMTAGAGISVIVNDKRVEMEQPPIMYNGRVMVPLRDVFEALGVAVFYEPGEINCVTKDTTVYITNNGMYSSVGDYFLFVNDVEVEMDQPPIVYNGRTMVPVRVISESLGASVSWDKPSETVTVTANIKKESQLTKAEIDAANAFTFDAACKKVADNTIYIYFQDRYKFWDKYPSFEKGVKSYNLLYSDHDGMLLLRITINGEVSFATFYSGDDEEYSTAKKYKLSSFAKYLPFQEKYDGYLCGLAYVRNIDEGLSDFNKCYFSKAPNNFWTAKTVKSVSTPSGKEYFFIFPKYEGTKIVIRSISFDKAGDIVYGNTIYDGSDPVLLLANEDKSKANTEVTVTLDDDITVFCPSYDNILFDESIQWYKVLDLTFYK